MMSPLLESSRPFHDSKAVLQLERAVLRSLGSLACLTTLLQEPNSENCLDLIHAALPCENVIIVPDSNYITPAIRKFMLDMPNSGGFQNIGLLT